MVYDIGLENFIKEADMLLGNLVLSYSWNELSVCKEEWASIVIPCSK